MLDLYNLIVDNITVPPGLEFLYPVIFVVLLVVGLLLSFGLLDNIFHFFKR